MTTAARIAATVVLGVMLAGAPRAADFPLSLVALASLKTGTTSVTSNVVITVSRLMEESRRTRVNDALKYNGYPGFVPALRTLPVIGSIELARRKVDIKYAHESKDDKGPRLVLAADRPLFFLNESEKPKAGYELTIVELRLAADGSGTGTMTGAARVKLAPDGSILLDDYADTLVQLTIQKK